jgi:RNA polymerase sigma-70 factor (ECF subfamily)
MAKPPHLPCGMGARMAEHEPTEGLARRAAAGDRRAFDELVSIYEPRIAALARQLLEERPARQQVDLADIVQETFAKAFWHIDRLAWKGEEEFFGWLSSIAGNIIFDAAQRARIAPLQLRPDLPDRGTSPGQDPGRRAKLDRLQKAIDKLSPQHRQAIVLARVEKLRVKEIAIRMRRSPNAVKKLLAQALQELRKDFEDGAGIRLPEKDLDVTGGEHGR